MNKIKKFVLPSLIIAMLVIVSILLSKLFTFGIIDTNGKSKSTIGGQSAFFVSVNSFDNLQDAENCSKSINTVGGAGYVLKHNNKNHVIVSMYLNKTDASAVMENIKGDYPSVSLIELQIKKKNIENQTLANDVNSFVFEILNFYVNNAIKLDKNEITKNNVLLKSLELNTNLDDLITKLEMDASDSSIKLRKMLKTVKNNLQLLTNFVSDGSTFKYMGINTFMDIFTSLENL